jgi:phosphatidylglycerophosphatase A
MHNRPSKLSFSTIFLSYFWTGFSPKAPGTVGSLATIPLLYAFYLIGLDWWTWLYILIAVTVFTCWITEKVQKKFSLHDPQWIVMDEVLGMMTTWLFIIDHTWQHYLLQFILFRFFDIVKFWPASYFDKKVEHGSGTILDDIVSGLFAGTVYLIATYNFSF